MDEFVSALNNIIWGPVLIALILCSGLYLTIRLKFLSLFKLGYAFRLAFSRPKDKKGEGDVTGFQALMTSLAATIGTGNIAGVATAIAIGGLGSIFWMWVSAVLGMAVTYGESVLGVRYREQSKSGMSGGPMAALSKGLKHKKAGKILAFLFAIFCALASLGSGNMAQANTVALAVFSVAGVKPWITGIALLIFTLPVITGGIKSIGKTAEKLVPFMCVFYISGGLIVIFLNIKNLLPGIADIFSSAFHGQAAVGGFAGCSMAAALRIGIARGVFSNEAGMGSAGIAAAAAKTDHPSRQGLISMTGVFIDTIIVCTVTGLAIAASGVWKLGKYLGVDMTIMAFESGMPGVGGIAVTIGVLLFAYCTIIGWEYFGEKSVEYILGYRAVKPYRLLYCAFVYIGCVSSLKLVWNIADIANGLMAVPNIIGIIALRKVIFGETNHFMNTIYKNEKLAEKIKRL